MLVCIVSLGILRETNLHCSTRYAPAIITIVFKLCIGPLPNTVGHFWQMVWDHKIEVIVMLTALVESGKVIIMLRC